MPFAHAVRRPVSTRHAFALAVDLAFGRDALHSVIVPFLLRAPWILALMSLPAPVGGPPTRMVGLVGSLALLGGSLSWWLVDAMLRFRARSVYNTPHDVHPAPVLECYERGLRRLPWLYLTEFVRGIALFLGFSCFFLPGVYAGYKLAFGTEAVVLTEPDMSKAFQHSFHLARGRFERWLEMAVFSVLLVLSLLFLGTLAGVVVGAASDAVWGAWKMAVTLLVVAVWPVFQYAWTFFYLRLVEVEEPQGEEVPPLYAGSARDSGAEPRPGAAVPQLTLVEPPPAVSGSPGDEREGGTG